MKNVTFVSALFDIDRVDGRKWDQYLKWFDVTLQLRVPMLLFITEDLQAVSYTHLTLPTIVSV